MIPFNETRALAHTMLSFGFASGDYLGVSVEVRLEKGESYSPTLGLFGQFELIYVVADERDLIRVRTEHRNVDVLRLSHARPRPTRPAACFVDVMKRVNQLHDQPEYYDTLTQQLHDEHRPPHQRAGPRPRAPRLPRPPARLCRQPGLRAGPDRQQPALCRGRNSGPAINDLALRYKDDPHFSQRIRGERVR